MYLENSLLLVKICSHIFIIFEIKIGVVILGHAETGNGAKKRVLTF